MAKRNLLVAVVQALGTEWSNQYSPALFPRAGFPQTVRVSLRGTRKHNTHHVFCIFFTHERATPQFREIKAILSKSDEVISYWLGSDKSFAIF